MYRIQVLFVLIISFFLIITACSKKSIKMISPATEKCINDGGKLILVKSSKGEYGVCSFSDGSLCEEWDYYKGKCKTGDCQKKCDKIGTEEEGWYDCNGSLLLKETCSEKE